MFTIAGRTFSLRSTRPATFFTPIAVALLVGLAAGTATNWQRGHEGFVWWLDLPVLVVSVVATADCLERLMSLPARAAERLRLVTLTFGSVILTAALFGPISAGILRWAAPLVAVPWALMVYLAVREGVRLARGRAAERVGSTVVPS